MTVLFLLFAIFSICGMIGAADNVVDSKTMLKRSSDKFLCLQYRFLHAQAVCQACGNCCREGAACAMVVGRINFRHSHFCEFLAIVKNIVDMHGGTIGVTSDLNGTVFTVKLKVDFDINRENFGSLEDYHEAI